MGLEADCLDPETQSCVVLAAASLVRTLHNKPPGWTFSAVRLWSGSSVGTKESKKVKQACSPSSRTSPFNILQRCSCLFRKGNGKAPGAVSLKDSQVHFRAHKHTPRSVPQTGLLLGVPLLSPAT